MEIDAAERLKSIGTYAFADVNRLVEKLKADGITPTDFGVGDPTIPTPEIVREATKEGVEKRKSSGYPSYVGAPEYRRAVAEWTVRRFGISLDPESEITSTIGSKEGVFNFHEGIINPGDVVLVPTPGYPPYARGTLFAEGKVYYVPILAENGFLPDLDAIPGHVLDAAKLLWLNYPNSPSGAVAPLEFFEKAVAFARKHNIILASDEAYSEIYYTEEPPHSLLEVAKEGVVVFQSLSKRSAMTGYRIGWVAGDRRIVDIFKKVKTNIDSGTPVFVQDGAIAALSDETHVQKSREDYRRKRDILVEALTSTGLQNCAPAATIYLWQKVPESLSSVEFAAKLLSPEIAIVTTPGEWISHEGADGANPGKGYVRFALVPSVEDTIAAAERIRKLSFDS